jgi:hypothetical protein
MVALGLAVGVGAAVRAAPVQPDTMPIAASVTMTKRFIGAS